MSAAVWHTGDVFDVLAGIPDGSIDLVVTSPPFLALRSYLPPDHPDKDKEIGSEPNPAEFLRTLLALTREWRRVLAPHGSIAVELGDTYSGSGGAGGDYTDTGLRAGQEKFSGSVIQHRRSAQRNRKMTVSNRRDRAEIPHSSGKNVPGWPMERSLCGIPTLYAWSLAYGRNLLDPADQIDPWRVRNLIAWVRPNPPVGALGDKVRPATSHVTAATADTTKCRRWFDLDAERTPLGAPLLDWWEITPGGYSEAHYAVFPLELPRRLINLMCPRQVCTVCGAPRRRITEPTPEHPAAREAIGDFTDKARRDVGAVGGSRSVLVKEMGRDITCAERITVGWTDCGHGSFACSSCGVLVPSDHAIRRPGKAQAGSESVSEALLLGESVEGQGEQEDDQRDVRDVRGGVPWSPRGSMLQPQLFSETGTQRGPDEQHRRGRTDAPEMGRGAESDRPGVRQDLGSAEHARSPEERVHDGTPGRDAGASCQTVGAVGAGPSSQRGQERQQGREPRSSHQGATRRNGDVPPLPERVSGELATGWTCPGCGCRDIKYVQDHWRNGIVLDPFAGSGTTLAAAAGLGRDAIGIDLDARNLHLARERVGMFLTEAEGAPA